MRTPARASSTPLSSPPRHGARRRRGARLLLVVTVVSATGCHGVGQEPPSFTGLGGADGSGVGGAGGAEPLGAAWGRFALAKSVGLGEPVPDRCADGSPAIDLARGAPHATCAACACGASGCEVDGLLCFPEAGCAGAPAQLSPGAACAALGGTYASCRPASSPTPATCEASGGEPGPIEGIDGTLAFCSVSEGEPADCVIADGTLPGCPSAFPNEYHLAERYEASCAPCGCAASCEGPAYELGAASCDGVAVSEPSACTEVGAATSAARRAAPACAVVGPPSSVAAKLSGTGPRTVCCVEPL